ncbi:UDP-N-acetylglucosamine 2-epimerase (non-hydrolyzing) [Pseudoalteromonas sp. OOF1S-7]|uniref:non-hydrolyzing UDP-N-acetylglucosamine 2-epimerase n=1 Tax=Pseudoalteromonas sp. OOF1S-7 TaxID=2917757 RepID=UPI001EF46A9E|nr:UDP-N-acetylglucosamine 2-epimerase (non-hydrolyzing) [Pseudoalteromonas sp. OOF1S-7]MCG7536337.1 UDP-N-acetylglucosamine 2-epimerase (non-hydrolyzing) [Pseudoalteromonas sp. OOF1S-7]
MKKLKVMTILGTRPEIIRLASVMEKLEEFSDHILVHTGQNYDYELNQVFFDELGVREPDYFLEVDTSSLGKVLGEILIKTEQVILEEKPDAVLVLGDTNSAVSVMMAKRMKVPTYHMEAGNRSFDANVPEEINRKLVDHLADFNLVYTENARRHLISEGLPHRHIYVTGSPMLEVLDSKLEQIKNSQILDELNLEANKYFVVSVHREENVDNPDNLRKVVACLNALYDQYKMPVVVSTHPRTRNRLDKLNLDFAGRDIRFLKPFGFFAYNKLQMNSYCVVSDSGTISEESAMLHFPAVTIRQSIERPEALDSGSIMLTGLDVDVFLNAVNLVTKESELYANREVPSEYQVENTSLRVLKLILGTASLTNRWRNLDSFSRYDW